MRYVLPSTIPEALTTAAAKSHCAVNDASTSLFASTTDMVSPALPSTFAIANAWEPLVRLWAIPVPPRAISTPPSTVASMS